MCHQSSHHCPCSSAGHHTRGVTGQAQHYRPGQLTPPLSLLYIVCDMWRVIIGYQLTTSSDGAPWYPWQPSSPRAITRQFSPNLILLFKSPPAPPVSLGWKFDLAAVLAGHYARLAIQIVPRVRLTAAITVRAGFRDQSFDTIKT